MTLNDFEPYIIRDFSDFWQLFASANIFLSELRRRN